MRERDREREGDIARGAAMPLLLVPPFFVKKNFTRAYGSSGNFVFHAVSRRKGLLPCLLQGASNGGLATVNPLNYVGIQRVKLALIARLDPKAYTCGDSTAVLPTVIFLLYAIRSERERQG